MTHDRAKESEAGKQAAVLARIRGRGSWSCPANQHGDYVLGCHADVVYGLGKGLKRQLAYAANISPHQRRVIAILSDGVKRMASPHFGPCQLSFFEHMVLQGQICPKLLELAVSLAQRQKLATGGLKPGLANGPALSSL